MCLSKEQLLLLQIANYYISSMSLENKKIEISNIDWDKFYQLIHRHKMYIIVHRFLKEFIPDSHKKIFNDEYERYMKIIKNAIDELNLIVREAKKQNVDMLVIKGCVSSHQLYDDLYSREFGDIDILVKEELIDKMDKILRNFGYTQTYDSNDYSKILPFPLYKEKDFYELFPYQKLILNSYNYIELKRNLHNIRKEVMNDFFKDSIFIKVYDISIRTTNLTNTFFVLCDDIYYDSEMGSRMGNSIKLRDYIDLGRFLNFYGKNVKWEYICKLSNIFKNTHQIFYLLNNLNKIAPNSIPSDVIKLFNPKKLQYSFPYSNCEDGSIIGWKRDFLERLFDDAGRILEFKTIIKQKCYSQENEKFLKPVLAKKLSAKKTVRYIHHFDLVEYYPYFNKEKLIFNFKSHKKFEQKEDIYKIGIRFLDSETSNDILVRYVIIEKQKNKVYSSFHKFNKEVRFNFFPTTLDTKESMVSTNNEKNSFKIEIPFDFLGINRLPQKLCYNVFLIEQIYQEIYYIVDSPYKNFTNPEVLEIPIS